MEKIYIFPTNNRECRATPVSVKTSFAPHSLFFVGQNPLLYDESKLSPRWPKMAPRGTKMTPRWPKMAPSGAKMAPGGLKTTPRWPQVGP